jgi:hypothetical protein
MTGLDAAALAASGGIRGRRAREREEHR